MRNLQTGMLLAATLSTGLMAGLFAAVSYAVMPGLARSSDRTLIETMQGINIAILNPFFILPFVGSIPLLGVAVYLAWRGEGRSVLPWLIAALALYLAALAVTAAVHVPLNIQLDDAGDPAKITQLDQVRADFEDKWVTWNTVRAVLHTAAFVCLLWALIGYGTHRSQDSGSTESAQQSAAPASLTV
ncbi:anthrone oxygenase family protein [Streptomyces tsukubensis]|uniref:anthrone oxygenase family protein n=1 Tax=Streptomyces tsukubensis TaxID=83656 RepID=UPI00369E7300